MVFNDIQDVQEDRVNSPNRPIPSGKVTIRQAYGLSVVFSAFALLSSLVLGILTFLTALVALTLMAYYNTRGKKTGLLGNVVVSFNVALPFFLDRKSTRLNSSHVAISYAVFCLKKKT